MTAEAWVRLDSEPLADYEIFTVRRVRARSPKNDRPYTFHILDFPDWVNVVAFTDDDRVILVSQHRHGIDAPTLEFPSGVIDEGEVPLAAARRELEEETGYRPATLEVVAELDPNPAIQTNRIHVVVARGCIPGTGADEDESEAVEVQLASREEVSGLIRRGRIRHTHTLAAWHLVDGYRD